MFYHKQSSAFWLFRQILKMSEFMKYFSFLLCFSQFLMPTNPTLGDVRPNGLEYQNISIQY